MSRLPHVGEIVVLPPGTTSMKQGIVAIVTKRVRLKRGDKVSMQFGGDGYSSVIETKPITACPDGWRIIPPDIAYMKLKDAPHAD